MKTATIANPAPTTKNLGYQRFSIGRFEFHRDEYFAHITYPGGRHTMPIEAFLRALMRDVAWGFFYGTVNFDSVLGTTNHYGTVDLYIGLYNDSYRSHNRQYVERFDSKDLRKVYEQMLADWTNDGFDPFAAPEETGLPYGPKHGSNIKAITRTRVTAARMVGLPGDAECRTDKNGYPVNRAFQDVPQDSPEIIAAPGFERDVHAFNLYGYLSRSDVTWNPSVVAVCKDSLLCPTTEEHILPITHGNDRVEWFVQVSDEIYWDIEDKATGKPISKLVMKAGDVAAMPANIRHRGYSPKRSMLIVWENNDNNVATLHATGQIKPYPVDF